MMVSPNDTDLIIPDDLSYDKEDPSFQLTNCVSLKRIVVGKHCFHRIQLFELNGLSQLESIVIGQYSFEYSCSLLTGKRDGRYRILNCPKLKSIQIGSESFSNYYSFELKNLPSLQSIQMGYDCFTSSPCFSLTGWIVQLI